MINYQQIFPHTICVADYPDFGDIQESIKLEIKKYRKKLLIKFQQIII